jgi:tRNA A-37 threonylcarbamoyl transferase component Bud32
MDENTINATLAKLNISASQWQTAMQSTERIEKITTEQGAYWLKKAAPARGIFRYYALNLFSWLLRLPLLKAVPQPGGKEAIANEVRRLKSLRATGVLVPEVLAYDDDWLLIEHIGASIVKTLKQQSTDQKTRQQLFSQCLNAIKNLHQQQQYLSQGFVRNMLLDEASNDIAFIDFEDDPLAVMTLPEAQARDLLLLVNSTARFFVDDQDYFNQAIQNFLEDHDQAMIEALQTTTRKMQWIANIPFQKLFGHDYQKLKVGILALKDI